MPAFCVGRMRHRRDALIFMDYGQYTTWSENVHRAKMEYLDGKLVVEGFLRRIDMAHELKSYETDKQNWWRKLCGNARWRVTLVLARRRIPGDDAGA